jgi:hypothetical protein
MVPNLQEIGMCKREADASIPTTCNRCSETVIAGTGVLDMARPGQYIVYHDSCWSLSQGFRRVHSESDANHALHAHAHRH